MVKFYGKTLMITLIFFAVLLVGAIFLGTPKTPDVEITGVTTAIIPSLAECLQQKNIQFYGTLGCSACKDQKKFFSDTELKYLYVDCGYKEDLSQKCKELKISEGPTWIINGQHFTGIQTEAQLRQLA